MVLHSRPILGNLRGAENELGVTPSLGALERYRVEAMHQPEVLRMSTAGWSTIRSPTAFILEPSTR